jgi:hypothetical protein
LFGVAEFAGIPFLSLAASMIKELFPLEVRLLLFLLSSILFMYSSVASLNAFCIWDLLLMVAAMMAPCLFSLCLYLPPNFPR